MPQIEHDGASPGNTKEDGGAPLWRGSLRPGGNRFLARHTVPPGVGVRDSRSTEQRFLLHPSCAAPSWRERSLDVPRSFVCLAFGYLSCGSLNWDRTANCSTNHLFRATRPTDVFPRVVNGNG